MAFEIIGGREIAPGKQYIEAACLSSDPKPAGGNYTTGSIAVEVDTGDVYFYDAAGAGWVKQMSLRG